MASIEVMRGARDAGKASRGAWGKWSAAYWESNGQVTREIVIE